MNIQSIPLTELNSDPKNARAHDEQNLEAIANSLRRFGQQKPIVINQDNIVVAGNGTLAAAAHLGWENITVVRTDLNDEEAVLYAIADNRTAELAAWDLPQLEINLMDLDVSDIDLADIGWSRDDLTELFPTPSVEPDGTEDDVPELQKEIHSVAGEVYELGPHRLVCGDSTDPDVWELLLGEEQAQCVWTDPPYGIAVVGGSRDPRDEKNYQSGRAIENDDLDADDLQTLLEASLGNALDYSKPGAAWYVASPNGPLHQVFGAVLGPLGVWRHSLIWVKPQLVFGRSDYHYRHEAIFYGWAPGAAHYFTDDRTQDSIFEVAREARTQTYKDFNHPTVKPTALVGEMIENSTKEGWIVADPFSGSGSTLMACAMTNRVARGIELDPAYCDVIRRRYTQWAERRGLDVGSGALAMPTTDEG